MYDFLLARPILLLILLSLPLFFLARYRKIFPQMPALVALAIPATLSLLTIWLPAAWYLAVGSLGLIFLGMVIDLWNMVPASYLSAEREVGKIASIGKPHAATLTVANASQKLFNVNICDDLPDGCEARPSSFDLKIRPKRKARLKYEFTSSQRGKFLLEHVYIKATSTFGFWAGFYQRPCESTVHVYPDMKQIAQYDLLARTNRLSQFGVRRVRKVGQDNEFERLRDYTKDDNYKHIDWRTTARRNKLTVKDFQSNQSQRIIFMIDCGRMMTGESANLSFLDHAFNAMLMLSYIALKQGDSVGLLNFSNKIHNYTPPRNGVAHINRLLHASFDQQARYVESRYSDAFLFLKQKSSKRSLVIMITNVIDEINANQVLQYASNLTGHHLPMCLLLKDHDLFDIVDFTESSQRNDSDGGSFDSSSLDGQRLYDAAAAMQILNWRTEVMADLKHRGVLAVETFPEQLTAELINRYLEIKARHLL